MYVITFKLRDLKLQNIRYKSKTLALKKYESLMNKKPKPISISMYYNRQLIKWDGEGSHFKNIKRG